MHLIWSLPTFTCVLLRGKYLVSRKLYSKDILWACFEIQRYRACFWGAELALWTCPNSIAHFFNLLMTTKVQDMKNAFYLQSAKERNALLAKAWSLMYPHKSYWKHSSLWQQHDAMLWSTWIRSYSEVLFIALILLVNVLYTTIRAYALLP